ncbi:MAG: AAA family ATPase [Acidimicrobiia bacterium]|nr:MAG: AAA family ATPase [Acidimicrobiia bacterium]
MNCANCGNENPAGAAFCMGCGSALAIGCANCGTELPSGAAFCPSCGTPAGSSAESSEDPLRKYIPKALLEKLQAAAQSGGGLEGERRRVTMLFCDLQGSSAAAQNLDPEDWAEIMNGAFEHLITPVYRYEGTLARLMGDAILAFFGAPIAHEDDPERAVRAALEILEDIQPYREQVRREHGVEFDVRVGINTGLVVVGAIGSDMRVEYTAMGDAVNVAARMEQTAAPGTIQISDDTKASIERLFAFEDLGPVDVKGRTEPVRSWRVLESLDRPSQLRGIEGLHADHVGREAELATLETQLSRTREGAGAVVSVMAEAGLGKSRLVAEFRAAHPDIAWFEGRSLSFETTTSYAAATGVVRGMLGLGTGPATWGDVEAAVADVLPARVAEVAPFLLSLLGGHIPEQHEHRLAYLDPGARQAAIFTAAGELLAALASRGTVAVVFEDVHWADSASIDFIAHLADLAESTSLLLVLIYRPRRDEPSWELRERIERDHPHLHTSIALSPLPATEGRELIRQLLDMDGLTEQVRFEILERSDGNPYFLEEVIRSMIDAGILDRQGNRWIVSGDPTAIVIPDTLHALLATRLDGLTEFERAAVQAAAVFGREFRYEELAAVIEGIGDLDAAIVQLRRKDLIREIARVPRREYRFKHALVQETAYEGLLKKRRTQLHARAGHHLAGTQPDRVEDIADHFLAARLPDEALPWLVEAAEKALAAYLLPEARRRVDQAMERITEATESGLVRRVYEVLGRIHEAKFEMAEAVEVYERLIAEGDERGDLSMRVSGMNKRSFIRGALFGETEDALRELAEAEQLAEDQSIDEGLVEACVTNCYIRSAFADFDQVEHYMKKVAGLGADLGLVEPRIFGMVHHANTLVFLTRFDEGLEMAEKAMAMAEEHGHLKYQAELLTFAVPFCHLRNGDVESALAALERGMEISLQIGDRASETFAAVMQGKIALNRGHFDEAVASHNRAMASAQATGVPYAIALGQCTTGTCFRRIGGDLISKASALHEQTLETMEMPTGKVHGAWMWAEIGHCSLQAGDREKARSLFNLAIEEQTATMWLLRPAALAGLAEVAIDAGDLDAAEQYFADFKEYVTSRRMLDFYIDVELLGARLAAQRGDVAHALADLARTEGIAAKQGLRRMLLDVHFLQFEIHGNRGDEEGAESARRAAMAVGEEILAETRNEELRTAFRAELASRLG